MKKLLSAAAVTCLLLTAACSGAEETQDGVTAKERSDLDNAAMMLEGNQIIDTSADSLVLEENAAASAPSENGAAPPAPTGPTPAANAAANGNQAAPR